VNVDRMLTGFCLAKLGACARENGPTDLQAMLHAKPVTSDQEVLWTLVVGDGANPQDRLPEALATMVAEFGALEWAGFMCDAHVRNERPGEPMPRRGDFAREYASAPVTDVSEALVLTWRSRTAGGLTVAKYHFPEGPLPVFAPIEHHRLLGGAVDTALRAVIPE
jgi:hypothetical protein